jgi:hypothetical protein
MKLKTMMAGMAMMALSATAAMAIPSWMGVYGAVERHAAGNPGSYVIQMNQDYWGLNAEVGVQVIHASLGANSGKWQTFPMAYSGNKDGNSIWKFTPAQAYPAGATVNFYFHGWDTRGGNLWDSNGGKNYSFTAETVVVFKGNWGSELNVPHAAGAYSFDVAAADGMLYAVWQEGGIWADGAYVPPAIKLSRKTAGHSWELPRTVAQGSYPAIAASSAGVFVLFTSQEWPQNASLIRSADKGGTWSAPVNDTFQTRYARLRADAQNVYVAYDEFTAPETSKIYFRRKTVAATAWESAKLVFDKSSYKATVFVKDFDVRGNVVALSTYLQGWYGGFNTTYFHESVDGGQTWLAKPHGLDNAQTAVDGAGKTYVLGYLSVGTGGGLAVSRKAAGGAWETLVAFPGADSMASGLQVIGNSLVALSGAYDQVPNSRVSSDGGWTWSGAQPAGIGGGSAVVDLSDGADMHVFYSGGATLSTGAHGQGDPLQWAGNVSPWPSAGNIAASDILWINAETWPAGTASEIYLVYTADGATWQSAEFTVAGLNGNNDAWHAALGSFPAGTAIRYAIQVIDNRGTATWLNNGGKDYSVRVNP